MLMEGAKAPMVCIWCAAAGVKRCDFPVQRSASAKDAKSHEQRGVRLKLKPCGLPMCADHADHRGGNLDFCPQHKDQRLTL